MGLALTATLFASANGLIQRPPAFRFSTIAAAVGFLIILFVVGPRVKPAEEQPDRQPAPDPPATLPENSGPVSRIRFRSVPPVESNFYQEVFEIDFVEFSGFQAGSAGPS